MLTTVMSLFYVGSIVYIEDVFLIKKKSKNADSLYDYLSYTALGILQGKKKENRCICT